MEVQSNFVALIQTDVDTSEFTKSFPCQHLALSLLYLDESNSIQFTYLRERTMRKEKLLTWNQHLSLHQSPLSNVECKSVFLPSQAYPGMEWVEIL